MICHMLGFMFNLGRQPYPHPWFMSWLLSLVPLARGAPAVGSCALQVSQTRFEPLIKYGLERRDAWQAEDGGCEGPELYRAGSVVRVPLAARAGRAAQASAAHEALQELRALEAQRWSQAPGLGSC